jgi:hypothetical protein
MNYSGFHLAGLFWAGSPEALIVDLALRGVVALDFQGKTKVLIRQALVFFSPLKFQLIICQ